MSTIQKIRHFFGFFNLTPFEHDLLSMLRSRLPSSWVGPLDSQLGLFNQTDRVLEPAEELPFGHTSFYWSRFGKVRLDYPKKFPSDKAEDLLATVEVDCLDEGRRILVKFVLVHGFLFSVKYFSEEKKFTPQGSYVFENFELQLTNA